MSHCASHSGIRSSVLLLTSVPLLGYLVTLGNILITKLFALTIAHPFASHLEYMGFLVVLGSQFLDDFHRRKEIRPFILVVGQVVMLQ